jgi:hypothetical protein
MKFFNCIIPGLLISLLAISCSNNDDGENPNVPRYFNLKSISSGGKLFSSTISNAPVQPEISITFNDRLDKESARSSISLSGSGTTKPLEYSFINDDSTVVIKPTSELGYLGTYWLTISDQIKSADGKSVREGSQVKLVTQIDPSPKFEAVSDEELLTLVQEQTFRYFWDLAEPMSGMARERNSSGDLVTTGGTGFGLMAMIVAIERNFITRQEGIDRLNKILTFLENADRFHGAWSHWVNGTTGKVIPFSANDNGGDLVETSFLIQGLITFRQYLDPQSVEEKALIDRINTLWKQVEWGWYTKGENVLYWHWSPDKEWIMNHAIRGHNETLITYVLAASAETDGISADVYHKGYARGGDIVNGKTFYNINLPLGEDYGGPLFFAHYSFLGLDPRNLEDQYANYWVQNTNHSKIHHAYAVANPKKYVGYSDENWGLTASDNHQGYSAHSPTNDLGVISPTAAISSIAYTPEESLKAIRYFYYILGDRLWGQYGFFDAFNLTEGWVANSTLAIDQGPIIIMIENHRTGLLWDLFMSAPEVQNGLTKLGFQY